MHILSQSKIKIGSNILVGSYRAALLPGGGSIPSTLPALEANAGRCGEGADLIVVVSRRYEAQVFIGLLPPEDGDRLDDFPHFVAIAKRPRARQLGDGPPIAELDERAERGVADGLAGLIEQLEQIR